MSPCFSCFWEEKKTKIWSSDLKDRTIHKFEQWFTNISILSCVFLYVLCKIISTKVQSDLQICIICSVNFLPTYLQTNLQLQGAVTCYTNRWRYTNIHCRDEDSTRKGLANRSTCCSVLLPLGCSLKHIGQSELWAALSCVCDVVGSLTLLCCGKHRHIYTDAASTVEGRV